MSQNRHLLYERLYAYVIDEIRKGALRSGDRVPSEKELARTHGGNVRLDETHQPGARFVLELPRAPLTS